MPSRSTAGFGGQQPHLNPLPLTGRQGKGCPCVCHRWSALGQHRGVQPSRCPSAGGTPGQETSAQGTLWRLSPHRVFLAEHWVPSCHLCRCPHVSQMSGGVCSWRGPFQPRQDPPRALGELGGLEVVDMSSCPPRRSIGVPGNRWGHSLGSCALTSHLKGGTVSSCAAAALCLSFPPGLRETRSRPGGLSAGLCGNLSSLSPGRLRQGGETPPGCRATWKDRGVQGERSGTWHGAAQGDQWTAAHCPAVVPAQSPQVPLSSRSGILPAPRFPLAAAAPSSSSSPPMPCSCCFFLLLGGC